MSIGGWDEADLYNFVQLVLGDQPHAMGGLTQNDFVRLVPSGTRRQGTVITVTFSLAAGASVQTNVTPSIPASPLEFLFMGGFLDTGFSTTCGWSWGALGSFGAGASQYPLFIRNNGASTATGTLKVIPVGVY